MYRLIGLVLLVFANIVLANDANQKLTPVSIKLHWQHQFQFAGIYAALEKGFYQEAGLAVNILNGQKAPFNEVENGDVDFGISGAGLVVERLKGRPFVALAAIFQSSPYTWLVQADSDINHPNDFIGKTVTRQSYADDLSAMLLRFNIHPYQLNIVDPTPDDIDNLIAGKVDALTAYISNEPFWMREKGVNYRTLSPHEFNINFYSDIIFTSEQYLKRQPQIVDAFRDATIRGWQYALEQPHEMIEVIEKNYNSQNKSRSHLEFEAEKLSELSLYPTVSLGHMTLERWQRIAEHYQQLGLIKDAQRLEGFIYDPTPSLSIWLRWLLFSLILLAALTAVGYFIKRHHTKVLSQQIALQTAALAAELEKGKLLEDKAKRESERLQTLLNHTMEGVITIDETGIIQNFNVASVRLFGYQPEEIIGQNITRLMPAQHRQHHEAGMSRFLSTEQSKIIGQPIQLEALHKSGQIIPIELTLSAFKWEGHYFFTGIARDISLQKAEHLALIAAKEEAEKANQAKSEFLSAMSHELRTPLNAVLGFAHLLQSDKMAPLNETQQDSLKLIIQSGEHLLKLINDVLELAKIETGTVEVSIEPVDVNIAIKYCLPMLQNLATRYKVDIITDELPAHLVLADLTKLKQILINLVSNAIKYNRPGGEVIISGEIIHNHNRLRITVKDTGIGIPQDKQAYLFTAFDRLGQENSGIEGTGVGLIVTQRLIKAMNGHIGFESAENIGSRFWVELPITTQTLHHTSLSQQSSTVDAENPFKSHTGAVVLHIEDNPANIKLMEAFFDRLPQYQLHVCKTAEAGLKWLENNIPEVILMDINLPGISGLQATEQIIANPKIRHIPVIAVTAAAMPYDLQQAEGLFTAYLTKPVNFSLLTELLNQYAVPADQSKDG
ncbi:ABC transporter substrate-binding protein [Methylophaga sp.]|uniref:ABC transporter substrate-binding protein n=1 Tax=Methylophaga sp. TaxID=2024840 RepID=UPI0027213772|nr:ABC transporter substrate-binding protein [Methylophaga sp.]MDO8826298.1 ABC transporter substrate-binding protein [Methylophaga sp.]